MCWIFALAEDLADDSVPGRVLLECLEPPAWLCKSSGMFPESPGHCWKVTLAQSLGPRTVFPLHLAFLERRILSGWTCRSFQQVLLHFKLNNQKKRHVCRPKEEGYCPVMIRGQDGGQVRLPLSSVGAASCLCIPTAQQGRIMNMNLWQRRQVAAICSTTWREKWEGPSSQPSYVRGTALDWAQAHQKVWVLCLVLL